MASKVGKFWIEKFVDAKGKFRSRIMGGVQKVIWSGEAYVSEEECDDTINSFRQFWQNSGWIELKVKRGVAKKAVKKPVKKIKSKK